MAYCKVWVAISAGHWQKANNVWIAIRPGVWKPMKKLWWRPSTTWSKTCAPVLPTVTTPKSGHVAPGGRINVSVHTTNADSQYWEQQINHKGWVNKGGGAVYSTRTQNSNGVYWVRCVATNVWGTTYGTYAVWTVGTAHDNVHAPTAATAPYIRGGNLSTIHVRAGAAFSFSVAGWGGIKYVYWQYKQGTGPWTKIAGSEAHGTYSGHASRAMNNRYFRLYALGNNGVMIWSGSGKLIVS